MIHPMVEGSSLTQMTWPEAGLVLAVSAIVAFFVRGLRPKRMI